MRYCELTEAMPTDEMRADRYYHGTSTTPAAEGILRDGLQAGKLTQGRGHLAPVAGRSYITPNLCYAVIYALGANMMGHDLGADRIKSERYGYVFVIDGGYLNDIQPDEDSVGEFVAKHTEQGWDRSVKPWRRLPIAFKPDGVEDEAKRRVWHNIRHGMTARQFSNAIEGYISAQAAGGKRALKRLLPSDKLALIRWGAHVAHGGVIPVNECWRIDKTRSKEIAKDCSNFFQIAERIK